jgi:hypothetical protein
MTTEGKFGLEPRFHAANVAMNILNGKPEVQAKNIAEYKRIKSEAAKLQPQWSAEKTMMQYFEGIDQHGFLDNLVENISKRNHEI